jgi:hypothetical protein
LATSEITMSSTPPRRRCRFATICGSNELSRSRGTSTVLVDHAAEYLSPPDWQGQRGAGLVVLVGGSLSAGLVGPVPVVMVGILAEDRSQVAFVVDEQPVVHSG